MPAIASVRLNQSAFYLEELSAVFEMLLATIGLMTLAYLCLVGIVVVLNLRN
ncbi:MAG: hypothetical protein NVS2B16_22660 [Chloroflexota bacterium]